MGLKMMVTFVDNEGVTHNFRHAFFSEENGGMPPDDELGVYMLLDRNYGGRPGPGTHRVLYVGQARDGSLRNRMFSHAEDPEYADRYRNIETWPYDVLFVIDADPEISARAELGFLAKRTAYEGTLFRWFVPLCAYENQFRAEKARGAAEGCVPTVMLDLEAGTIRWARQAKAA
jgi:hypothetical protein